MIAVALVACGRVGFDDRATRDAHDAPGASDAMRDGGPAFVPARGMLDPTFGTAGVTRVTSTTRDVLMNGITARGDGYAAIGIDKAMGGNPSHFGAIGLSHDGSPDPAYGAAGLLDVGATPSDYGYGAAVLDVDHLILVGDGDVASGAMDDVAVAVIDLAGAPDPAFAGGGMAHFDLGQMTSDTSTAVAVGARIVVCGVTSYDAPAAHVALVGIDRAGALDPGWGAGGIAIDDFSASGKDGCFGEAFAPDGSLLVTGSAGPMFLVAAYGASGARSTTFAPIEVGGPGGAGYAIASVVGDVVAVGESNGAGFAVRASAAGVLRSGFGQGGQLVTTLADLWTALAVQPDGKLVLVGGHAVPDGTGIVVRLEPDGSLDPSFGTAGVVVLSQPEGLRLNGVLLDPDGRIVVVGVLGGGFPRGSYVARLE